LTLLSTSSRPCGSPNAAWACSKQDEAAEILLALDRLGVGAYVASDEELGPIDVTLAQIEAGEVATDADIEAAYSRFRK
jgi:hypothetical protein